MEIITNAELSSMKTQVQDLLVRITKINDQADKESPEAGNRNTLEIERHLNGVLRELEHISRVL